MTYQRRILDDLLDEAFPELAAIAIEGAKGVGKTATASRRAKSTLSLNDPRELRSVSANFDLVVQVPPPVFIDEWQLQPQVWDRVRRAVDDAPEVGGRFLLAGSAGLAPGIRVHSGAGRIVSMTMRPMSLYERGMADDHVSLSALHSGDVTIAGSTTVGVADYVDEILRSGFPGIRHLSPPNRDRQLDGYLARIVQREMPDNGITLCVAPWRCVPMGQPPRRRRTIQRFSTPQQPVKLTSPLGQRSMPTASTFSGCSSWIPWRPGHQSSLL